MSKSLYPSVGQAFFHEKYLCPVFSKNILLSFFFVDIVSLGRRKGTGLLRLSELSGKEIVDVNRAEKLGLLGQTDLEFDESGQIKALIIPSMKWFGLFRNGREIRVSWSQIKKVGTDMLIIDFEQGMAAKELGHDQ